MLPPGEAEQTAIKRSFGPYRKYQAAISYAHFDQGQCVYGGGAHRTRVGRGKQSQHQMVGRVSFSRLTMVKRGDKCWV